MEMSQVIFCCYVPETHVEQVKQALFTAGAGQYQQYDSCCWSTTGEGQFRPLVGSEPFLGQVEKVETVVEMKLEMLCAAEKLTAVVAALRQSHPYQEPAFHAIPVMI